MKKLLAILFICIGFVAKTSAQDQEGLLSASANLSYGSDIKSLGVGLRMQYGFTEHIRGAAEYKYYIDRKNMSAWELNTNVHYVFGSSDELVFYPIGGLKFTRWTRDIPSYSINNERFGGYKNSKNYLGLNLGFGSQIAIAERFALQPELTYEIIKDHSQFVVSVGICYQF